MHHANHKQRILIFLLVKYLKVYQLYSLVRRRMVKLRYLHKSSSRSQIQFSKYHIFRRCIRDENFTIQ